MWKNQKYYLALAAVLLATTVSDSFAEEADLLAPSTRGAMIRQVERAFRHLDGGAVVRSKLMLAQQVLPRVDGCAERGRPDVGSPAPAPDWIDGCEAQNTVYPRVVEILERLEALEL